MLPQGYLSVSQINKYLTCPKSYYYKYVEGLPESKSSSLLVGSSFHSVIEQANKRKLEDGELINDEDIEKIYNKYWNENNEDIDWNEDEDPNEERERGITLAKAYLSDIGKDLDPIGIEARFDIEVAGVPFMGYIDLIENNGAIRDLKTAKKSPSKDTADKSIQLAAYALAYRELTGNKESSTSLDYAVSLKTPKIVRLETEITDTRIDRLKDTVWEVANGIEKEVFPRNEAGFGCSYCSFKDICKGE